MSVESNSEVSIAQLLPADFQNLRRDKVAMLSRQAELIGLGSPTFPCITLQTSIDHLL